MSLQTTFSLDQDIGGVIGCSGHLLPTINIEDIPESKKQIPIFLYHGESDGVIPCSIAEKQYENLIAAGFNITFKKEKYLEHSVSPSELDKIREFFLANKV